MRGEMARWEGWEGKGLEEGVGIDEEEGSEIL